MRLPFFFLFILIGFSAFGQDLIVKHNGDSLNCKITREAEDRVYFTYKKDGEYTNDVLSMNEIISIIKGFYIGKGDIGLNHSKELFSKFKIGANGGLSYFFDGFLSSDMEDFMKQYFRELRTGYNYNFDIYYYPEKTWGVGLYYNAFFTQNQIDQVTVIFPDSSSKFGSIVNDIKINYIGPALSYRYVDENNSFILYSNLSVGLLSFQDIGKIVDPWEISGTALGQGATLGVEYFIDYGLAVGIQLSGVRSILKKYEIYDGTGRFTVNEARHDKMIYLFDLSAGLRYIR